MRMLMVVAALVHFFPTQTIAQAKRVYIALGQAQVKKSLFAIAPIKHLGGSDDESARELLATVLNSDAEFSNLFTIIPQKSFLENASDAGVTEDKFSFTDWAPLGAEFLLKVGLRSEGGKIILESRLYDVFRKKLILGKKYQDSASRVRSMAHMLFNDVVEALTGEPGVFQTKIAMVCRTGANTKQIVVTDMDGANPQAITSEVGIKLVPAWSPDGRYISYTMYRRYGKRGDHRDLMVFDTRVGGSSRLLYSHPTRHVVSGLWHPQGHSMLVVLNMGGGATGIYKLNLKPGAVANGEIMKLIQAPGFDIEPDYSPDGKWIVFSSFRAGRPMIFVTDSAGGNPKRITWAGAYNSAPVWSPKGDKIVFQGQDQVIGKFDLFILNASGGSVSTTIDRLTMHQGSNENPSFSPDGRHIVFASDESGRSQIYRMNIDGTGRKRLLNSFEECQDPVWSPLFR